MQTALAQPDFAEIFERVLVPSIFDRYARDLIARARPIGPSDRVLDLGCGTGIVARALRERLGGGAKLAGVDVSPKMIAKARSLAPDIEWHEGDALALPFADGSFDLVLCQQMLQFVPDRLKAVREMRRVLAPRGRLLVSTWKPRAFQPLHDALGRIAERHLGTGNDKRYSLDADVVTSLLSEAGFSELDVQNVSLTESYREFPIRMNALAGNFDLGSLDDEERERRLNAVESESRAVLERFFVDGEVASPSHTTVISAVAP
jgi:ubiquinone/menaquinone biosynthesis C-methylase UbiE